MLLDHGADVNAPGGDCSTALQGASLLGHEKVVQILLYHGADVNAGIDSTALDVALAGGHEKVVQILLNNGGEPESEPII